MNTCLMPRSGEHSSLREGLERVIGSGWHLLTYFSSQRFTGPGKLVTGNGDIWHGHGDVVTEMQGPCDMVMLWYSNTETQ